MDTTKLAILEQRYKVAIELRQLAALLHGRDSAEFKKANEKCLIALSLVTAEKEK